MNGHAALPSAETPSLTASALLTPEQLSERWSVPKTHVYRLAREGRIPSVRLGKYVRFTPAAIEAFEREGGCAE